LNGDRIILLWLSWVNGLPPMVQMTTVSMGDRSACLGLAGINILSSIINPTVNKGVIREKIVRNTAPSIQIISPIIKT
jgi:hypothetical protein